MFPHFALLKLIFFILLMTNDIAYLYFLSIYVSIFLKWLHILAFFKIQLHIFLLLRWVAYRFWVQILCQIYLHGLFPICLVIYYLFIYVCIASDQIQAHAHDRQSTLSYISRVLFCFISCVFQGAKAFNFGQFNFFNG